MTSEVNNYKLRITWSTLLGVTSFGILVPTFFIPLELWSQSHFISVLVATVTSLVTWEGCKYIQSVIAHRLPWAKSIARRLTLEILSIFLFSSLILVIGILIYDQLVVSLDLTITTILRNIIVTFLIALLFTAINEGTFLFGQWKKSLIAQEQLKKEALEAKLENLKKQLDPHFLFNSLSVLSGIIHKDVDLADTFITKLSLVYRYVLEHNELKRVSLSDELKFVESYVFLLKVRFQEKISLDIHPELQQLADYVLPLSIQLLIENAVKHNKLSKELKLKLYKNDDKVWLENNLDERQLIEKTTGTGLNNLKKRYWLQSEKEVDVIVTNTLFKVGIPLLNENK